MWPNWDLREITNNVNTDVRFGFWEKQIRGMHVLRGKEQIASSATVEDLARVERDLASRRAKQWHNALEVMINLQPDMVGTPYYGIVLITWGGGFAIRARARTV